MSLPKSLARPSKAKQGQVKVKKFSSFFALKEKEICILFKSGKTMANILFTLSQENSNLINFKGLTFQKHTFLY